MSDIPSLMAAWTAISLAVALFATLTLTVALVVGRFFNRHPESS